MMKEKLKIDIISDVVCPWCTVGYKRLEKAIEELGVQDKIEIEWQPFELNPNMPIEGQDLNEHLAEKYGSSEEQLEASKNMLVAAGQDLGFTFDYFEEMRIVNTFEAHVLLEYAKKFGKQTELKMRLTTAYFSEGKNVSKREVLKEALLEVGLDAVEALKQLDIEEKRKEVSDSQNYWKSLGVNSVPTVVFNRRSAVTGAQPISVFKQVLQEQLKNS